MKELIVYILKCSDDSYYTGITNDLNRRCAEHEKGQDTNSYTFSRRPIKLVWSNKFHSELEAIRWEKKLKGWTRKKKEALIENKFEILQELAECKNKTNYKNKEKGFDSAQPDGIRKLSS
jgi:putative endonuclease